VGSMDAGNEEKPRKRATTTFNRSVRDKRISERTREGWTYDEVCREEKLSERRVRQILKEALEGREALKNAIHVHVQVDRAAWRCGPRAKRWRAATSGRWRPLAQGDGKARPPSVARARGPARA